MPDHWVRASRPDRLPVALEQQIARKRRTALRRRLQAANERAAVVKKGEIRPDKLVTPHFLDKSIRLRDG